MKVEVKSRKLIKPCKPTPHHLKNYKISLIDEINPSIYVIRILYYPPADHAVINGKQVRLEESLAQVLPLFYPLAGRYVPEERLVDCNDEGAEYSESQVDCELFQLIDNVVQKLNQLLPVSVDMADEGKSPMLAVQINRFQCGGLAIGVCASHRVFDSCSLSIFLTAWANVAAASDGETIIKPDFNSSLFFPPENINQLDFDTNIACKRIVFDKNAISRLRDTVNPNWRTTTCERTPSRVVLVSAVLTQALLRVDSAINRGRSRASVVMQAVNVRERTVPPVPKYACGSWASFSDLESSPSERRLLECDFPGLVRKIRDATMQGVRDCVRILSDKDFGRRVLAGSYLEAAKKAAGPDYKVIWITDWSKFGDYEVDFGFGKPVWVSLANIPLQDIFILMNTKENDGIEAWVCLNEALMAYFEEDEDIKMLIKH